MVMTSTHDILLQGNFGTRKVALAISVCEKTVTEQEQLKKNSLSTSDVYSQGAEL